MASALKSKVAGLASSASSSAATREETEQYKLVVTAGPSYDQSQHQVVQVNTGEATYVENEFLRAKINVRVRGFRGLPSSSPSTSDYFDTPLHEKDQYSLGFSFVPKQDLTSVDTVWGNDLDHPIRDRLPPGFNTAFRIVKEFIDPGLACDVYADEPWLYGPSLSCWFALRIGDEYADDADFPAPGAFTDGADGSGKTMRDEIGMPDDNEKRRKFFLSAENRQRMVFKKGRLYQGDFYNPYLDFANFALKLPGFSLKVIKYIGEKTHCLRYVFKNRATGNVYFNVNFTLLWGDKLRQALENDEGVRNHHDHQQGGQQEASAVDGESNGRPRSEPVNDATEQEEDRQSRNNKQMTLGSASNQQTQHQAVGNRQDESSSPLEKMQLHAGDHEAIANSRVRISATSADDGNDGIDEIDRLLRETSTNQKRQGRVLGDDPHS